MDNNKLIIGIIVAVAAFLGAPFALRALRPVPTALAAAKSSTQTTASNAPAAPQNPAYSPGQPQTQIQQQPQAGQPGLDAQSLVGTQWEVSATQGTVKFQFNAGGQGLALHPIMGQIGATWTCSGNQVNVTLSVFNQTTTVSALIQGNTLVGQGCTIRRLQ